MKPQPEEGKASWNPISTAPKTGETIEISYGDGDNHEDNCLAFWSDARVCMIGMPNGSCGPGWATPIESDTDTNLPLDEPNLWRQH